MKKIIIVISSVIILVGVCYSTLYYFGKEHRNSGSLINRISSKLFDSNGFRVVSNEAEILNKIVITNEGTTVYNKGTLSSGITNKHGYTKFIVFYDDDKVFEVIHFKTNSWHQNDYIFQFNFIDNKLNLDALITGPDAKRELYCNEFEYKTEGVTKACICSFVEL